MKTPKFWQEMTAAQKKETRTTAILIVVILGGTFGAMGLARLILNTRYPMVVVTSGSMLPDIKVGDLLFVKGVDPEEIVVGDHYARNGSVIIYDTHGLWGLDAIEEPVVHRVVNRTYNNATGMWYFLTQGDNNGPTNTDPPNPVRVDGQVLNEIWVPEDHVLGMMVGKIPWIGNIKIFLDTSGLTWILIAVLAILLVISIVQDIKHPEEAEAKKSEAKGPEPSVPANANQPADGQTPPEDEFNLGT